MFVVVLLVLGFCIVMYFSLLSYKREVSIMANTIQIIQKDLNNVVPDIRSLIKGENEYLITMIEKINSIEHEIENLKLAFEENNHDLLSDGTTDADIDEQIEDIKNGILRIEKYFINQFKFNDVLAKEISDNKYNVAYVKAKLSHDLPTTSKGSEIHDSALQSTFRSYSKSIKVIYFPGDGEDEYCFIYLDFARITPNFDSSDFETDARTLIRACMGYENAYYIDSRKLVYDDLKSMSILSSSELEDNRLWFDEYSHIDHESEYVLKKGISVCAYVSEKKIGHPATFTSANAKVISVKKSIDNDYGYDVILKIYIHGWSIKNIIKKFTIDDFPCVVDEQYVIALMTIDPTKSPVPTESFGVKEQLPSGFDPKTPILIQYGDDYWFYGNTDGNNWKTQKLEPKPDSISQWFDINFSSRQEIPLYHHESVNICNYFTSIKAHTIVD